MVQEDRFDVLIVGGGPAGMSLALALGRFLPGVRLGLVDRRPLDVPQDSRASAIAAGVRRLFEALGVWPAMATEAEPVRAMRLTDSGSGDIARPLFLRFEGELAPHEPFAHMVPNPAMGRALLAALEGLVRVIAPAEIRALETVGGDAALHLADGRTFYAPLVVAADGARSALRAMAGIATFGHDYGQSGIVATIAHAVPHEGVAYEHFRPAGPFASLPLPGNRSSLVWTEARATAERLVTLPHQELAEVIEEVMGSTLGTVRIEDKVMQFPLRLQLAQRFVAPRLALVGDAAHVIHPIAGQGLNLGLKDVAALAEIVVEALRLGMDPGAADVLGRYESARRFDTVRMAMVTDGMNRLFSNDSGPLRALRDLGLGLVDRAEPLKAAMIRTAAGTGDGPKLLSGLPI